MVRYLVVAVSCLLAAGCFAQPGNGLGAKADDTPDIYEAVFRYRLQLLPGNPKPAEVKAYLAVDGKDPPVELLKRLRKDWPNLRPASEEPKEKGLRVYVEGFKREAQDAVLKAGYWFPTKFAGEGYFADHHVIRDKGRCVVEKVTNEVSS